jgi:sugar lactone lactonase YvrE
MRIHPRALPRPLTLALVLAMAALPHAIAQEAAPGAPPPNPQRQLLAALTQLLERDPRHVGAIYIAARTAAGLGDDATAIVWLDRLEEVGMDDELDPDDFGAFAQTPQYRERAARFAARARPIGKAARTVELQCRDLLPEGTAWDAKRRELLVSSGRQRTVIAVDRNGKCRQVVPNADQGLLAVLGMAVDPRTDSLWVASTAAPFMLDAKDGSGAMLARIDLARGRVASVYPLPGRVLLNDLALAADGSVYVTESQGGAVYRLAPNAAGLTKILPADSFESPNGIVVLGSGNLVVADFDGLALVENPAGDSPRVLRLATPDAIYLGGIDGLARAGDRLIGIQNLVGRTRIWSLEVDAKARRVTSARVLMRGHSDFRNPTTGVVVGDRLVFVADPKLQSATPSGEVTPLPAGRSGHRVLEIPVGSR